MPTRATILRLLPLLALLVLAAPLRAQPAETRAGLVISYGDGRVATACVSLGPNNELTGEQLLRAANLQLDVDYQGQGAAICGINGVGCPSNNCFCQCQDLNGANCRYWGYAQLRNNTWQFSQTGASSRLVRPGEVDGWAWGIGTSGQGAVPAVTPGFGEICAIATSTPTPTPSSTPSATPLPTQEIVVIAGTSTPVGASTPATATPQSTATRLATATTLATTVPTAPGTARPLTATPPAATATRPVATVPTATASAAGATQPATAQVSAPTLAPPPTPPPASTQARVPTPPPAPAADNATAAPPAPVAQAPTAAPSSTPVVVASTTASGGQVLLPQISVPARTVGVTAAPDETVRATPVLNITPVAATPVTGVAEPVPAQNDAGAYLIFALLAAGLVGAALYLRRRT